MSGSLINIINALFPAVPEFELFHYTSIEAMLGIIENKVLWASDLRYVNDTSEILYFVQVVCARIDEMRSEVNPWENEVISQLDDWLRYSFLTDGPMIFSASFTEKGDLLSQWRGYTPHGRGISLGFDPVSFSLTIASHGFNLGKCLYDEARQRAIITELISTVVDIARTIGPKPDVQPTRSFWAAFESVGSEIMHVAPFFKHPMFSEEHEWRCVSSPIKDIARSEMYFRPGASFLIPYQKMTLPTIDGSIALTKAFIGPTPTVSLSMASIQSLFSHYGNLCQRVHLQACNVPYRA